MQIHSGNGDNIAGDKIIHIHSLNNIDSQLQECIDLYKKNEIDKALTIINTLSKVATDDFIDKIEIIKLYLNIDNINEEDRYNSLKSKLIKSQDDFFRDLIISSLLKYEIDNHQLDIARDRYKCSNSVGLESNCIWLAYIASLDEINHFNDTNNLIEQNLKIKTSIINGLLRHKQYKKSIEYCKQIIKLGDKNEQEQFREILYFIKKYILLDKKVFINHFWLLNLNLKESLDKIIYECIQWLNSEKKHKENIKNISLMILRYINYSHHELAHACYNECKNDKDHKVDIAILKKIFENDISELDEDEKRFYEAMSSPEYKERELNKILSNPMLQEKDYPFLIRFCDEDKLNKYTSSPSFFIKTNDSIISSIIKHYLLLLSNISKPEKLDKITLKITEVMEEHKEIINPVIIYDIGNNILSSKDIMSLNTYICFLKSYLNNFNHWFSPLYELYSNILLELHREKDLDELLNKINEEKYNDRCIELKSFLLEKNGDDDKAIFIINNFLIKQPYSISL